MRFLLACTLMGIALCTHAQVDRQAYTPSTLRQALAVKPKSEQAAYELDAEEARLRIRAVLTREMRRPGTDLAPLLTAWKERRKGFTLDKPVEIAINDHGVVAWVLVADPAKQNLSGITPGLPGNLFVHRIGFVRGQPVMVVADLQFGAQTIASARFASGQASFVYGGKRYVLTAAPAPNAERPPLSEYRQFKGEDSGPFESVTLDFESGATQLTMSMMLNRGPGDYPAGDGAGGASVSLDVTVLLGRGVMVHVAGTDFAGCTLKLPQLGTTRVQGRVDCPRPLASGLSDLAFEITP